MLEVLRSIGLLEVAPGARVEQVEDGDQPGGKVLTQKVLRTEPKGGLMGFRVYRLGLRVFFPSRMAEICAHKRGLLRLNHAELTKQNPHLDGLSPRTRSPPSRESRIPTKQAY